MHKRRTRKRSFEALESRQLLSAAHDAGGHIPPLPANPTPVDTAAFGLVTTHWATVQADKTAVHNDFQSVETAIKAAVTTAPVTAAEAALTAAIATAKPLI